MTFKLMASQEIFGQVLGDTKGYHSVHISRNELALSPIVIHVQDISNASTI